MTTTIQTTTTMTLSFHDDPGHAWLAVPKTLLAKLGIADGISPYSYQRGGVAYLEEDCDAPLFTQAARNAGIILKFQEIMHRGDAPCRSFDCYQKPQQPRAIRQDDFAGLFVAAEGISID
jgi:hypothetical protein